jgi:hypothetical protein
VTDTPPTARIWFEPLDSDPAHPWRYVIRIPAHSGHRVIGGCANTWGAAVEQLRAIWVEHSPDHREAS